jgi:hypothetical protein
VSGKEEGRKQHEVASTTEEDEFAKRFEDEVCLVSQLSTGTLPASVWLIDSGATCHMTRARELFESFTTSDSNVHVDLGVATKHVVKGSGTMPFWMESGGVLRVKNVLWVPKLRWSVLSVSAIEKKGYEVLFRDGQALIMLKGSSSDKATVFGVRESNLYRLKAKPMRAMASSSRVTEDFAPCRS